MVLQRIQTVYLLIAVILMAVFTFMPVFTVIGADGAATSVGALPTGGMTWSWLLLVLDVLVMAMCCITIFKYRDLKGQIRLAAIDMLVIVALIAAVAGMACQYNCPVGIEVEWQLLLPVLALVFVFLARRGMKHDKKLLADSERIR